MIRQDEWPSCTSHVVVVVVVDDSSNISPCYRNLIIDIATTAPPPTKAT